MIIQKVEYVAKGKFILIIESEKSFKAGDECFVYCDNKTTIDIQKQLLGFLYKYRTLTQYDIKRDLDHEVLKFITNYNL